jgi:hypothetical protein
MRSSSLALRCQGLIMFFGETDSLLNEVMLGLSYLLHVVTVIGTVRLWKYRPGFGVIRFVC